MHKSLSILITFCLSTFNYSQWDEIYSKNLIAEHFYQSVSTVFWSICITCFKMSPSDISSWNFMKSISHLSHLGHGSPTRRIIDYSSHAGEIIRFFYWCHTNLLFKSWTDKVWSKSDFKISISCLNWDWGKVKKWEGDKEADLKICLIIFSHSILSFKFWKESGKKMKKRR